jgi:hypothetical protein
MEQNRNEEILRKIEQKISVEIFFWRYDKREDVYINKWSISNNQQLGIQYRPEFETKKEAEDFLRSYLLERWG